MTGNTALLIIDVQLGMFTEVDGPPHDGALLLENVKHLLAKARAERVPVIYVQHCDGGEHEPLHPSRAGWQIHPEIAPQAGEAVVVKTTPDSFYKTTLQAELERQGIERLVVAGLQTEYCVDTTCRRAFSQGYDLTLVKDGHSTWATRNLTAPQVIAHHNTTLGNQFVELKSTAEVEFNRAAVNLS